MKEFALFKCADQLPIKIDLGCVMLVMRVGCGSNHFGKMRVRILKQGESIIKFSNLKIFLAKL